MFKTKFNNYLNLAGECINSVKEKVNEEIEKNNTSKNEGIDSKTKFNGMKHREIQESLGVHSSYISRWSKSYREQGVEGILLKHKGSCGYLNQKEPMAVTNWIRQKKRRTLWDVIEHIEQKYKVVYR